MSAQYDKIRAALTKRFVDNWTAGAPAALPLTEIGMPGHRFSRDDNTVYGRLSIQDGERGAAAIGGLRVRAVSVLFLQVFTPARTGTKVAKDAGDHFADIFDNQTVAFTDNTGWIRCGYVSGTGELERIAYTQTNWSLAIEQDDNR